MIYVQPGQSFEASASWTTGGLVGTITVAIYDGVGGTTIAPHTAGIVEVSPRVYVATLTAPLVSGQYTIVWSDGTQSAGEDLAVTTSAYVPLTPSPGPGMTVGQMLDEILLDRFEAEHRARAFKALNNRYAQLWAVEDWTWKYAYEPVTVQAGVQAASAPQDFGVPIYLWDDNSSPLLFLDQGEFGNLNLDPGTPAYWTVVNQQILLSPTPGSNATFSTYYRRRLIPLTDEGQTAEIPVEFQLALVHAARAELLAFYNDPTASDMDAQYQMDIEALRRDYLADATGQPAMWSSDLAAL